MKEVTTEKREFEGKKSDGPPLFFQNKKVATLCYVWKKVLL